MPCNPLIDPVCVVGNVVTVGDGGRGRGRPGRDRAGDQRRGPVDRGEHRHLVDPDPLPDLAAEPAVAQMQQWLLPVTAAVAVAGVIAAGARMAIMRRANPLLDVTGGLLTLAAATTLGTVVPALLLKAGDAWSAWVLQVSTGGQFTQRLTDALTLGGSAAPAVVLIFGIDRDRLVDRAGGADAVPPGRADHPGRGAAARGGRVDRADDPAPGSARSPPGCWR